MSMENNKSACGCPDAGKWMEILNLLLDNEATDEDKEYFELHVEQCISCFEKYEVEQCIRELIKSKYESKVAPDALVTIIRQKIQLGAL